MCCACQIKGLYVAFVLGLLGPFVGLFVGRRVLLCARVPASSSFLSTFLGFVRICGGSVCMGLWRLRT